MADRQHESPFRTARDALDAAKPMVETPQTLSPSYRLSFADQDFLVSEALRPVRLQLEYTKPELLQRKLGIVATVVMFGSARIEPEDLARRKVAVAEAMLRDNPGDPLAERNLAAARHLLGMARYYEEARRLSRLISEACLRQSWGLVVITGGGPGIMEAANRGAYEIGAPTMGLNIVLPHEQAPNEYITPELSFQFHYFAIRKMHFLVRARALVVFPGGFGTMDELFEALTLIQTGKIEPLPVLLFGRDFWGRVIDFDALAQLGMVSPKDLSLFTFVETAEEAWQILEPVISTQDYMEDHPDI